LLIKKCSFPVLHQLTAFLRGFTFRFAPATLAPPIAMTPAKIITHYRMEKEWVF
jgi:hypothetical protein